MEKQVRREWSSRGSAWMIALLLVTCVACFTLVEYARHDVRTSQFAGVGGLSFDFAGVSFNTDDWILLEFTSTYIDAPSGLKADIRASWSVKQFRPKPYKLRTTRLKP